MPKSTATTVHNNQITLTRKDWFTAGMQNTDVHIQTYSSFRVQEGNVDGKYKDHNQNAEFSQA
jgi:hypothetical protein